MIYVGFHSHSFEGKSQNHALINVMPQSRGRGGGWGTAWVVELLTNLGLWMGRFLVFGRDTLKGDEGWVFVHVSRPTTIAESAGMWASKVKNTVLVSSYSLNLQTWRALLHPLPFSSCCKSVSLTCGWTTFKLFHTREMLKQLKHTEVKGKGADR